MTRFYNPRYVCGRILQILAWILTRAFLLTLYFGKAEAAILATFDFEDGTIPMEAATYGNVDIVPEVAKQGINLACYGGNFCLRMAPGQGPRNRDAGITFALDDVQTGDIVSFWYIVVPEANNDFVGFSLTGPGFSDWVTLPPIDCWTSFSYTVPKIDTSGEGGPGLMAMTSTDWTIAVWVENVIGDPSRSSLWIDSLWVDRPIPEPKSILLFGLALFGIVHRKR